MALQTLRKFCAFILAPIALVVPVQAQTPLSREFSMVIGVQRDVPLTEDRASRIIATLTQQMTTQCGPLSIAWSFVKLPDSFVGAAEVATQAQRSRFRNTGTSVQIVPSIVSCGDHTLQPGYSYSGCAGQGGPIVLRDRPSGSSSTRLSLARTWAHEIGHAQGLDSTFPSYVDGHNILVSALMYKTNNSVDWGMSLQECRQFYRPQDFPGVDLLATSQAQVGASGPAGVTLAQVTSSSDAMPDGADDAPDSPVSATDAFLQGVWHDSLPIAEIDARREELLAAALQALDSGDVDLWPGSVVVLAYAGEAGVFERLRRVMTHASRADAAGLSEDDAFQLNEATIRAAGALSYVVYRQVIGDYLDDDATEAADLLAALSSPDTARWVVAFAADGRDQTLLAQEVARNATLGLALVATVSDEALTHYAYSRFSGGVMEMRAFRLDAETRFPGLEPDLPGLTGPGMRSLGLDLGGLPPQIDLDSPALDGLETGSLGVSEAFLNRIDDFVEQGRGVAVLGQPSLGTMLTLGQ